MKLVTRVPHAGMRSVVPSWGFVMAKIFVVENDSSTQKFLKMLLGWQHHEIVGFAISADEAKTAIAVVQPDLCLIDVNLLAIHQFLKEPA
jgi:chemotaxis response regulator CheB